MDLIVHDNIHLPIERARTRSRRHECMTKIEERRKANADHVTFLTTDHNTHGLFDTAFRKLGGTGLDFIGVSVPKDCHVEVLDHKRVPGTIDGHDFWGVRPRVTFASGAQTVLWVVQANLGRGETAATFVRNVNAIKAAFPGPALYGFDEIDEADGPDEHALLGQRFPRVDDDQIAGWGTNSPIIVRGAEALDVVSVKVLHACDGLAKFTPARPLVEARIRAS